MPSQLDYDNLKETDLNNSNRNKEENFDLTEDAWTEIVKYNSVQFEKDKELHK